MDPAISHGKGRMERSVARARVAVAGARPRATREPTQADTSAAVIAATGQLPKRGRT
ncbi:MAG TPA: hypothetical protein VED20_02440 [Streptosporangiaceae bacterium]|nr:hypothetical protein [Streptosporangiaceae bacterium]